LVKDIEISELIRRIIDDSLGELARWQRPVSLPGVGPAFPEVYGRFEDELSQWRAKAEGRLALWSGRELGEISSQTETPSLNPLFDEQGRLGSAAIALRRLKAHMPQDFVGGWAVAGKEADLPYWSSFATVSLEDLVFLSLGREPRTSNMAAVCKTYGRSDEGDSVLGFLEDRLELIANAMGVNPEDGKARVALRAFFDWVDETSLPIDPAFHRALSDRYQPVAPGSSTEAREQPTDHQIGSANLDPRERSSLMKLIAAMAIDGYGYDPKARQSPIPKEIETAVLLQGLKLTTKTILKYLREGCQYLPKEEGK
jgi:hypothetical protein